MIVFYKINNITRKKAIILCNLKNADFIKKAKKRYNKRIMVVKDLNNIRIFIKKAEAVNLTNRKMFDYQTYHQMKYTRFTNNVQSVIIKHN